jgi:hypothetical protein
VKLRGTIDVVTLQTLARRDDIASLTAGYGLIVAVGAIECGNHPGILDITHGQCSITPNAARRASRGSVMFRDRHYGSRPFCEVVISHTTPRGRSGKQAGEPPPE